LWDVDAQTDSHDQHGAEQRMLGIKDEISNFGEMQIGPKIS